MMRLTHDLLLLIHVLLIVVWLGGDLVVFWLSMSLLNRERPIAVRLDRAHIAEEIDRWVVIALLLTIPIGFSLAHMSGYRLFETPWLSLKLAFFGIILLVGIGILTGAAGTTQTLERIAERQGDVEALEARLRRRILVMAPPAVTIHVCIVIIIFIALTKYRW
ncbi:MAG: DUF2269 family protein [Acidobacteria bacterium]|nr:MAG: DUF2269 family protein [Acidobacteriota bacterium]